MTSVGATLPEILIHEPRLESAMRFLRSEALAQRVAALRAKDSRRAAIYTRNRRARDAAFRIRCALRCRLTSALKTQSVARRNNRTVPLLGCSLSFLCAHLEQRFRPGMSWDNYGEWEIDHIRPCALFNLRRAAERRACFHWSNLQPLWKRDNRRKGARLHLRCLRPS